MPAQVIKRLRLADVAMAEGSTVADASRKIGGRAGALPLAGREPRVADRPGTAAQAVGDRERAFATSGG